MIASLLFTIPVAGLAVGVAAGAIAGKKSDVGIDDKMIKAINDDKRLNTSAIFMLIQDVKRDVVVPVFSKYGDKIVQTIIAPENEAKLLTRLDEAYKTTWKDAR